MARSESGADVAVADGRTLHDTSDSDEPVASSAGLTRCLGLANIAVSDRWTSKNAVARLHHVAVRPITGIAESSQVPRLAGGTGSCSGADIALRNGGALQDAGGADEEVIGSAGVTESSRVSSLTNRASRWGCTCCTVADSWALENTDS